MSPNKDWFSTYQPIDYEKVFIGNNVVYKFVGIDIIQIKMHDDIVK